jgi:hypothetical protein
MFHLVALYGQYIRKDQQTNVLLIIAAILVVLCMLAMLIAQACSTERTPATKRPTRPMPYPDDDPQFDAWLRINRGFMDR